MSTERTFSCGEVLGDLGVHLVHVALGEGEEDVLLVVEVLVERGHRSIGRIGDVTGGQGVDTALDHDPGGRVEESLDPATAALLSGTRRFGDVVQVASTTGMRPV